MAKIILPATVPRAGSIWATFVGSLRRRVELQNSGEFDEIFIMIADAQALTDNADNPEKVRQNIIEVALDYLAAASTPNGRRSSSSRRSPNCANWRSTT